jgi:hypothetical protein
MKNLLLVCFTLVCLISNKAISQNNYSTTNSKGWKNLFGKNLEFAQYDPAIWKDSSGVLTASKDESIWSKDMYDNFILDLDFQTADGTNSGVIVHATETKEWIPHSVEIQIADDYSSTWSKAEASWQCGAIFGHKPATNKDLKKPGEWNHYAITCMDKKIMIELNGTLVNECNMDDFTSSKINPDGTKIPGWLYNPMSTLALHGYIGLQGKHAGAPIYFKNIKIKTL